MRRIIALITVPLALAASAVSIQAALAPTASALNNGLARTPPMGWNDWNAFKCNVSEQLVEQTALAMHKNGMQAAGYQYVNIDDCWAEPQRDANGNLVPDPAKFPDGIKSVADYVHSLGLKLGIYEDSGTHTCSSHGFPGSLGHEYQDALTFAEWRVDYLKYDDCDIPPDGQNQQATIQRYDTMRDALAAARAKTGHAIVFSICEKTDYGVPNSTWSPVGNLWRTTGDIHDTFASMLSNFTKNVQLADLARPGAWNDPDMLEIGNGGMTATEERTEFSLWAEMAAPLIAGTDLRSPSAQTLATYENKNVIAVDQDRLGQQGRPVQDANGLWVLTKPLADGSRAVVLFNSTGTAATISTTATQVGLWPAPSYSLKDLWQGTTSDTTGTISGSVPAHGVIMYRVTRSGAAAGTVIHVSPHQGDTLARAQQLVRSLDKNMHGDITVELESGTYRLTQPLSFTAQDSGTNGHDVVWTAAPGAHPVLSGSDRITGWRPPAPGSTAWSAPVPAGLQTRQLYVNGVRADVASGPLPVKLTPTSTGYTASAETMDTWRNPSQIEFVYTGGEGYWSLHTGGLGAWTEPRCPVAAISGTTITMAEPCWDNSTKRVLRTDGSGRTVNLVGPATLGNGEIPAYAANAYELLTQPGQWYLDGSGHTIYYIPRPGQDMRDADVEAPVLQTLVSGQGARNLVFKGIQYSYATWLTPSTPEGFSEIQANYTITGPDGYATQGLCQFITGGTCPYGNWTQEPGNVDFNHDTNVRWLDDTFTHLGAAGLRLGDGSQNDVVQGSIFTDISGNGIEVGGVDEPEPAAAAEHTTGNQILDNHFYALPVEYHGGVAIDVGYAERTLIAHNQIDNTAYTAISLGWGGWPDKIKQPATPNYSNGNVISGNLIENPMQELADGGAIYTQGITGTSLADGEQITGNVILSALDHGHAIYTDNGATFITVNGNVEFGDENDWGSRHTDYTPGATGDDPLVIENNYWQQGDQDSSASNVTVSGNHIISALSQAPASILGNAGLQWPYRSLASEDTGRLASVPEAPDQVAAFAAAGKGYVAWNPSFVANGAPVTGYTVTASPGGASVTVPATAPYAVVPGLTNGTAYTFAVRAINRAGASAPSLPSAPVTVASSAGAVPSAPAAVKIEPGNGTVSVHITAPASAGGTPVIGYTVSGSGIPATTFTGHHVLWGATGTNTIFVTIGGLTSAQTHTFSVAAVNATGTGAAATASG